MERLAARCFEHQHPMQVLGEEHCEGELHEPSRFVPLDEWLQQIEQPLLDDCEHEADPSLPAKIVGTLRQPVEAGRCRGKIDPDEPRPLDDLDLFEGLLGVTERQRLAVPAVVGSMPVRCEILQRTVEWRPKFAAFDWLLDHVLEPASILTNHGTKVGGLDWW